MTYDSKTLTRTKNLKSSIIPNVEPYKAMLEELAAMRGDVIGFLDDNKQLQLNVDHLNKDYRDALRRKNRKDRVIVPAYASRTYLQGVSQQSPMLVRKHDRRDFQPKFDIAICDGIVFVCQQVQNKIVVYRLTDQITYEAYKKFFTDLWIAADYNAAPVGSDINYTVAELRGLLTPYNVADAHTHQDQSISQQAIVQSLPSLWNASNYQHQAAIEAEFIQSFFDLRQCPQAVVSGKNYINNSASAITALISNFIRSNNLSVGLISPCFDNLPDLLKDGGTLPTAIDETILHTPDGLYDRLVKTVTSDVLFIVNPNNPTGFCLDEFGDESFRELARYCRDHHKLLILDLCFMLFICRDPRFKHVDCYDILDEYGVTYITIEDTGKIFPIMDTKAAIMHVSDQLVPKFERLHTNYILRHSPFVLKIVTSFIKDAIATDLAASYDLIQDNYNYLAKAIRKHRLPLSIRKRPANLSVAWIAVRPPVTGKDLQQAAQKVGIELLNGNNFFWDNPDHRSYFIRIALARNTREFRKTIDKLVEIV